jgi:hypothetical protein
MYSLNLFPRAPGGPLPFLFLDGHGSCFQLPFMWYIEDEEHKWKLCIGVPNVTAHWQVGDTAEQNGSWKMATAMPLSIKPTDIVPVCNSAWRQYFARVESNKCVISRLGWNPLNNRGLLRHDRDLKIKVSETKTSQTTTTLSSPRQGNLPTEQTTNNVSDSATVLYDLTTSVVSSNKSLPKSLNLISGYAGDFVTGTLQYVIKNENNNENLKENIKTEGH